MLRVAQIIDSVIVGGAEKLQVTFAEEALKRDDVELTIICLRDMQPSFREDLEVLGVDLVFFEGRKVYSPGRFWRLLRFIRQKKFDVIHAHLSVSTLIAPVLGALTGTPVISTIHNVMDSRQRGSKLRESLEDWMLTRGAKEVIAVGHVVEEANKERLKGRSMQVIHNAVPQMPQFSPEENAEIRREIMGDPDHFFILTVGRLLEQKGYCDLITAFAEVHQAHPNARLAIAGEGPLHGELQEQIDNMGLTDVAQLLGIRRDVPRLLAACDLFVSSSWWEGHPVAVLEAMASGVPVIATQVGEVPVMLVEGTGVGVPPKAPDELSEAMLALVEDDARRIAYGQAARDHIMSNYSAEKWVDKLLALYKTATTT